MNTLQINNEYALAFGLSWLVLDPMESRHARIGALRDAGARWAASFRRGRGGDENIGTAPEMGSHDKKSKVLSGAAQLASMPAYAGKNVIMLLEDPGHNGNPGLVALVTLINGNVSFDEVLSPAEAERERTKFEDQCDQSNRKYITCGTTSTIRAVAQPLTWDDLLPQKINRFKSTAAVPVVPLKSQRGAQYSALGVMGILIGFGALTGYEKYEQYKERQRALEEARRVDPEALYAVSSKNFLAEPVPSLKDAIVAVKGQIASVNSRFAGWRLSEVTCTIDQCKFQWLRQTGTFAEFAQQAPKDWRDITYSDDGSSITSTIALQIPKRVLPATDTWIARKDFQERYVSEWQRYSDVQFQFALSQANLEALPPGVAPEVLQHSPSAIRSALWSVQPGAGWYFADGLANAPAYVTFESLKILVSNTEPTFEAKGKVYVKS